MTLQANGSSHDTGQRSDEFSLQFHYFWGTSHAKNISIILLLFKCVNSIYIFVIVVTMHTLTVETQTQMASALPVKLELQQPIN